MGGGGDGVTVQHAWNDVDFCACCGMSMIDAVENASFICEAAENVVSLDAKRASKRMRDTFAPLLARVLQQ